VVANLWPEHYYAPIMLDACARRNVRQLSAARDGPTQLFLALSFAERRSKILEQLVAEIGQVACGDLSRHDCRRPGQRSGS
jgi:hypothetical protein